MDPSSPPPLLVALSGPSSSGKTTIASLLPLIFPSTVEVIHTDDFYLAESDLPLTDQGVRNWDCVGSLDWGALRKLLHGFKGPRTPGGKDIERQEMEDEKRKRQGAIEDGVHGFKDRGGVSEEVICRLQAQVLSTLPTPLRQRPLIILDGFLLLGHSVPQIRSLFDVRIFLRASFSAAKARRERRSGYVTLEGFWEDPPGYFEEVVWPGYVREYGWLFEDGDVDGKVDERVAEKEGIMVAPMVMGVEEILELVVEVLVDRLKR